MPILSKYNKAYKTNVHLCYTCVQYLEIMFKIGIFFNCSHCLCLDKNTSGATISNKDYFVVTNKEPCSVVSDVMFLLTPQFTIHVHLPLFQLLS